LNEYLIAVGMAVLGGITHELLEYYEVKDYEVFKDSWAYIALSAIVGTLWYILGLPNHFNEFLAGYAAPSVLAKFTGRTEALREKIAGRV